MKKTIIFVLLVILLSGTGITQDNIKIHPDLRVKMASSSPMEKIPVYILFDKHMNLSDFADISYDTPKKERRQIVIERLQNFSKMSQGEVRNYIEQKYLSKAIDYYEIIWMNNTIALNATTEIINTLAVDYSNVQMICYDFPHPIEQLLDLKPVPFMNKILGVNNPLVIEPGILLMNADDCWVYGNKGAGVLAANADDGFWWKHPDLVKGVYQNLGEDANNNGKTVIWGSGTTSVFDAGDINGIDDDGNGKVDDLIGWDFTTNNYNITTASHGSATLGHLIGDGTMGTQTGIAPEAKAMVMRNGSGATQQWAAFQYAFLMGADVVTSSLSWKWYMNPKPDYSAMRLITDMSLAGGMIHTNSTSNDGNNLSSAPIPVNISSAGNNPSPWRHPEQTLIGNPSGVIGVGNVGVSTDVIESSSPYGPSTWGNWHLWGTYTYPIDSNHKDYPYSRVAPVEPDSMGLLKPDVSAPGQGSISTYVSSGTGYGSTFGGTSSATPHTCGAVMLMVSINPELLPVDIDKILQLTSIEKGAPGKDPRYGAGRIDAFAATSSPKFTLAGINGGSNWVLNSTLAPSDTARELVGLKISTTLNPLVGSLKSIKFGMTTNATSTHIISFDLYWDKDKNNIVSIGDKKLKSLPFQTGPLMFDSLKFKFLDTARTLILVARTTSSAGSSQTVNLGLTDTNQVVAYYVTKPFGTNFPFGTVTEVKNNTVVPYVYSLSQNFPNPFNPSTIIRYSVAKDGFVKIKVYDLIGKEVATLVNGNKTAGDYQVEFDVNDFGYLSSGIYFYKIEAGEFSEIKKMTLIK
jgi:hypothetical protein